MAGPKADESTTTTTTTTTTASSSAVPAATKPCTPGAFASFDIDDGTLTEAKMHRYGEEAVAAVSEATPAPLRDAATRMALAAKEGDRAAFEDATGDLLAACERAGLHVTRMGTQSPLELAEAVCSPATGADIVRQMGNLTDELLSGYGRSLEGAIRILGPSLDPLLVERAQQFVATADGGDRETAVGALESVLIRCRELGVEPPG